MNDWKEKFAAMQRDLEMLKERLPKVENMESSPTFADSFLNNLKEVLQEQLTEKEELAGFAAGFVSCTANEDRNGSTWTRYSLITLTSADDLPTDEQLVKKAANLAALSSGPLPLGVLRELLRLRFAKAPMRRTLTDLATRLKVSETELRDAVAPLVENGTLETTTVEGEEFYEWKGTDLSAVLLMHA